MTSLAHASPALPALSDAPRAAYATEPCMSARLLTPFMALCEPALKAGRKFNAPRIDAAELDARIPHSTAQRMLRAAIEITDDPAIGLHAAEVLKDGSLDLIEYIARTSGTVHQAMKSINRYLRLMHDAAEFSLDIEGESATWRIGVADGLDWPRESSDYTAALLKTQLERASEGRLIPKQVRFRHGRPDYSAEYSRVFECEVVFNAEEDVLVYVAENLKLAPPTADERLHAILDRHANMMLRQLPSVERFSDQVRALVEQELDGGEVNPALIARKLHVSGRTLRRRLQEENTSYLQLVEEARRELALQHLAAAQMSISEIAFMLGFSRITSFYRAFRRWTGLTPGEYRARPRTLAPEEGVAPSPEIQALQG